VAKRVSFESKPKRSKSTDFNFGFNTLNKSQKRSYTRRLRKAGHKTGGGS
jgi:hypothetical protein